MNINPKADSTQPHTIQPQPMPPESIKPTVANKYKLRQASTDQFQPERFPNIAKAWKESPDARPDVIAAAKHLVTDANYPTPAQLSQLAKMIVGGGDHTLPPTTAKSSTPRPPMTYPPMIEPPTIEPIEPAIVSASSQTQPPITEPPMTEPPMIEPPTPVIVSASSQSKQEGQGTSPASTHE